MKNERQEKILAIIAASAIETQEQLIDSLRKEGISCTQATISRDIKQLHLIKEPTGNGTYRYAVSTQKMRLNLADRLQTILRESIVSVDCAQNLVLIKTMAGLGPAAGAAFDGMDISAKVGTVAGDGADRDARKRVRRRALLGDRGHAETAPDQVRTKFCRRMSDA